MPALKTSIPATAAVLAVALAACGSTSHPQSSSTPSTTASQTSSTVTTTTQSKPPATPVLARKLEHALLAAAGPPRPTAATCLPATAADRRASPFGASASPVFSCDITVAGTKAGYYVQVLKNGCFVAERRRVGRAIYGCGVG
jgi:hypothetical protein